MADQFAQLVVVDDDQEVATLIGEIGKQAGFSVRTVTQPRSVFESLNEPDPDTIVLDLQMPELDGIQVLRVLAERKARAGIVLVSGVDERIRAAAEAFGNEKGLRVLATIQKPFEPEDLLDTLRAARAATAPLTAEDLELAIAEDHLLVYYQPTITRAGDGSWKVSSVEALLRWDHPDRGLLSPDEFLPMGERSGLIRPMTDYVIRKGLEQLKGWQLRKIELGLRLNLSASLLTDVDFPDRFEAALGELDVDPASLTLEITETAMLDHHPDTFDILTRFRLKRINLAIDDFGIGYSSLTQLFRMPFNEMKIDKSLLSRVPQSTEAKIMVEALVNLAHKLNLTVCAEGVESNDVLSYLHEIGCDSAQGFYISRPVPSRDVVAVLEPSWAKERLSPREEQSSSG